MKIGLKVQESLEEEETSAEFESEMKGSSLERKPDAKLEPKRLLEAALFQANRPMTFKELSEVLGEKTGFIPALLSELKKDYDSSESSITLSMREGEAALEVKPVFLDKVAFLSKSSELSRKATKILALIGKKGQMLQSDLKHYFKGEIYLYTTELKDLGYIDSKKQGNTRLLSPSKKFFETFQLT
ncbi:MAG: SMC-Scp complex subunit ScpB [Candidatus Micrarchaeota archaeon]